MRDANDRDISEYFTKGATKAQAKPKVRLPGAHRFLEPAADYRRSSKPRTTSAFSPTC